MTHRKLTIETVLYYFGLFLLFPIGLAAGLYYSGLLVPILEKASPCLFHRLTGFYCPGCGGTIAVISLLQGHVITSFLFHPIVDYLAFCYLFFMASQTLARLTHGKGILGFCRHGMRYHDGYVYIGVAIILVNFAIRNLVYWFTGLTFL